MFLGPHKRGASRNLSSSRHHRVQSQPAPPKSSGATRGRHLQSAVTLRDKRGSFQSFSNRSAVVTNIILRFSHQASLAPSAAVPPSDEERNCISPSNPKVLQSAESQQRGSAHCCRQASFGVKAP